MWREHSNNQQSYNKVWIKMKELDIAEHIEQVNSAAMEYLKGKTDAQIAEHLGIPKSRATVLVREWKTMASNSDAVRVRAREALAGADKHYTSLIAEAYGIAEEAKIQGALGQQTAAIKLVLDIERSRLEMLQKAGLLENRELAEQLVDTEAKQEAIMKIIRDVVSDCPVCKPKVLAKMAGIGKDPVVIYDN